MNLQMSCDEKQLSAHGCNVSMQVSGDERLLGPSRASQGVPLTICSLEKAVRTPGRLATLMERHRCRIPPHVLAFLRGRLWIVAGIISVFRIAFL